MTHIHPLDGSETLQFEGKTFSLDRTYFPKGFRNAPVSVWADDSTEIHYRPYTREFVTVNLETAERNFAQIDGQDGDTLILVPSRQ